MYTLYGDSISGNCWKPAFMLRLRGWPFRWVETSVIDKATRTPEFLAKNPNGRVPLLERDGQFLAESNAMLLHLGEGTPWVPAELWPRAKVYEWLFFEQYSQEPYIASVRFWAIKQRQLGEDHAAKIADHTPGGYAALGVMEKALANSPFLVGETPTVADVALYAYTHVAHEGGFDLASYPAVTAWLQRFAARPEFVPMPCTS